MQTTEKNRKLVESALLVAVATVLGLFPLVEMPYGGTITAAAMFPLVLAAYRNGFRYGIGAGFAYGIIQQLLGLRNLTYFTTWQSILAVILLDYLLAFAMTGFGGIFRRICPRQNISLLCGGLLSCVLRYICHVISGATVWAGLSIPTDAAIIYSLIYNATYMIPETLVLLLVCFYIGSLLDFRSQNPKRFSKKENNPLCCDLLSAGAGLVTVGVLVFDIAQFFFRIQNPETGEFDIMQIGTAAFREQALLPMILVTVIGLVIAAVAFACSAVIRRRHDASAE